MNKHMDKLVSLMAEHDLDAMALNPGQSLVYLTGLHFHLMERPTILIVTRRGDAAVILPALEQGKLTGSAAEFKAYPYGDDPATWQAVFEMAANDLGLKDGKLGVEPTHLRYLEIQYLQAAFPGMDLVDGSSVLDGLRICKDETELAKMRKAAVIAQEALLATLAQVREGMSEKVIANELIIQLLRAGSDPELPFEPIVALGENSANPHAVPTERALKKGDLLLVDWGAAFEGYLSDITRTFTYGTVDEELHRIGEAVLAANQAGRESGGAGITAGAVDAAARKVIEDAGYGAFFTHRTGHGLGMEAHEQPYIFGENDLVLQSGMTFTVEPGIYLPGRGGVRIEDDVVVTENGLTSLTDLPRAVARLEEFIAA
ncbi:Xaa-Pro peptidase family protein [bacterium]|nr:Xaa-Pro peptidase family protein [bacterium]